jgi:hypothetical protein
MIKKDKPRIYTSYEISAILFYATMILYIPLILVFTYVFDIENILNINIFLLWLVISNFIITVLGSLFLIFRKDKLLRTVKANYVYEFYYLVLISVFGILGFVVFYDYVGGDRRYIANILILVVVIVVYVLLYLGRKFFNFDYMKRK